MIELNKNFTSLSIRSLISKTEIMIIITTLLKSSKDLKLACKEKIFLTVASVILASYLLLKIEGFAFPKMTSEHISFEVWPWI